MNNSEAKEILDHNWTKLVNPDYSDEELGEAQNLAIKALEREESVLKALEDVRAEIEALYDGDVCAKEHNCDKDVLDIIDRKIAEVKGE